MELRPTTRELDSGLIEVGDLPCGVRGVNGGGQRIEYRPPLAFDILPQLLIPLCFRNIDNAAARIDEVIVTEAPARGDLNMAGGTVLGPQSRRISAQLLAPDKVREDVLYGGRIDV